MIETDMYHVRCERCHIGTYQETGYHDDMDGVLHCPNCRHEVPRWIRDEIPILPE